MTAAEFNFLLQKIRYDKKALEKMYDEFYGVLVLDLSKAYGIERAKDAAQEFFLSLLEKDLSGLPYIEYPHSWMLKGCSNIIKRQLEREALFCCSLDDTLLNKKSVSENDSFWDVRLGIEDLPEDERRLVFMRNWAGYSLAEISNMTGENINTVKSKYHRAVRKLKTRIK